ncbi:uncharacterized protein DEA37_0005969 [Paragonimus westermani]|uniref:Uncharacterized protein n=1 Tax=Paragonimus westermani TaxID=34504 RepID=A0A5J4NYS0_9TREM|nr:uncharacterized protein DEA37_0005969 [Paragonimus westermani]
MFSICFTLGFQIIKMGARICGLFLLVTLFAFDVDSKETLCNRSACSICSGYNLSLAACCQFEAMHSLCEECLAKTDDAMELQLCLVDRNCILVRDILFLRLSYETKGDLEDLATQSPFYLQATRFTWKTFVGEETWNAWKITNLLSVWLTE